MENNKSVFDLMLENYLEISNTFSSLKNVFSFLPALKIKKKMDKRLEEFKNLPITIKNLSDFADFYEKNNFTDKKSHIYISNNKPDNIKIIIAGDDLDFSIEITCIDRYILACNYKIGDDEYNWINGEGELNRSGKNNFIDQNKNIVCNYISYYIYEHCKLIYKEALKFNMKGERK